jgi:7-cyano-7-deazaguanine synthase
LAVALREGYECHALTIDYGQRHAVEVERAAEVASSMKAASHRVVKVDLAFAGGSAITDPDTPVPKARADGEIGSGVPVTYVPARNAVFLSVALGWAEVLEAE